MPNNEPGEVPAGGDDLKLEMSSEKGYIGLRSVNGVIYEDSRRALQWPRSNRTFQEMSQDVTIGSALSLFERLITRVPWHVEPAKTPTEEQTKQANFVSQCMHDMEHSWLEFMNEVVSMYTYGYCVNEKVFRRRRFKNGSKYNDGLVGIRKLPVRSQNTIHKWIWNNNGRDLAGVVQDTNLIHDLKSRNVVLSDPYITIKRKKFLLFRTDVSRGNPQGRSPLAKVWTAWQFRRAIEEAEAIGVTRGLGGIPYFQLHPKYMAPDASDEDKAVYEAVKEIGRNLQNNEQACVIFPTLYDDNNNPLFDFELIGPPNASQYDTNQSIVRWDNKILQALFADLLQMGNNTEGSHNLAQNKSSLVKMAVEARLAEIRDTLNNDLIPHLYEQNGWDRAATCKFEFGQVADVDIDAFSRAIQRIGAVGLIQISVDNVNYINETLGLPSRVDADTPIEELREQMSNYDTGAAEGMESGTGSGTAKSESKKDNSTANKENK